MRKAMNKTIFWDIIHTANTVTKGDNKKLTVQVKKQLAKLEPDDLLHFQFIYEVYEIIVIQSTKHLIWSALYIINHGQVSDTYAFAGWLIAKGKETFLNAFKDAESLGALNPKGGACFYEGLRFLAASMYKEKFDVKMKAYNKLLSAFWLKPSSELERIEIETEIVYGGVERNRDWELEDLESILPKLHEKFIQAKN
jgi:Protein of unknown function (DUF4240)